MDQKMNEPIILKMKSWRQRNCWARLPDRNKDWTWNAGGCGHCSVWYCRTPWGALLGAWKLHQLTRPLYLDRRTLIVAAMFLAGIAGGALTAFAWTAPAPAQEIAATVVVAPAGAIVLLALAISKRAR